MTDVLFWICMAMAAAGAIGAAMVRNLVRAALLLGLCLCGMAGVYLFLDATWLACVQVVVYMGGILVLLLFATLFSSDVLGAVQRPPLWLVATGAIAAIAGGIVTARLATVTVEHSRNLQPAGTAASPVDAIAGDNAIGDLLTGPWAVPFLATSVLLTTALVGAVATVKRYRRGEVADA